MDRPLHRPLLRATLALALLSLAGCTSFFDYVHHGFKVGPDYCRPPAGVAKRWIDADDKRVRTDDGELNRWWTVFDDPALDHLVECAYRQNLSLREAGFRVLEARMLRGIAVGELFPQTQVANGGYNRVVDSETVANRVSTPMRWYDQWNVGFGLAWELDFWGRFRRAVESADAELNASVEDYDDVLVTLLADVGTNYVQLRTLEKRLELARTSVQLFDEMLRIAKARYTAEAKNRVPYDMARANLAQAQALIPKLEISRRQTENQLCILLGMPPRDLHEELGAAAIPAPPVEVAVGIPADLLRRRPDVRRSERQAAAQSAQIGVAASDFYPQISIEGTLGVSSKEVRNLFKGDSLRGEIGPGFQWNILNYGRIRNNVLYQDARFQELVTQYQQTVLKAGSEADSAIVAFLQSQERAKALLTSAASWRDGTEILVAQYRAGLIDFFEVAYFEQNLIEQQDEAAQAQGDVSLALVEIYRALGGGWQIRLEAESRIAGPNAAGLSDPNAPAPTPKKDKAPPAEVIPAPKP